MAITRRQFLKRSGLASAGFVVGPALAPSLFGSRALADTIGGLDRYLVILFLNGGNDGLGTIIPVTDEAGYRTAYEAYRQTGNGGLRIPSPSVPGAGPPMLDPGTGTQLGFHPGLAGNLQSLYEAGHVAVVQGCGYPEYSLSHDESSTIWQTANPLGLGSLLGTGAVGRHLAAEYTLGDVPAVTVDRRVADEFRQSDTNVLAIRRLKNFSFPYDDFHPPDEAAQALAFAALHAGATGSGTPIVSALGSGGAAALDATNSYGQLHADYEATRSSWSDAYDAVGASVADRFNEAAKILFGVENQVVDARFLQIHQSGYDTHSNQGADEAGSDHRQLLSSMGGALSVFYADLADMGIADKVTTLVYSEFSRRIPQNSNGTDHGAQGPMFVVGEGVNGGVYGNHPDLTDLDSQGNTIYRQNPGDPARSTDFRDVYGTTLKHWVGDNDPASILPADTVPSGGDPDDYWTSPDFDLGFV